jgi:hypothetical protein
VFSPRQFPILFLSFSLAFLFYVLFYETNYNTTKRFTNTSHTIFQHPSSRICNFNRHYAEYAGYWETTDFLKAVASGEEEQPIKFYDSVTGALLFTAPIGRSMEDFIKESKSHGWPSFRDDEVNWEYVRCLKDGEAVSTTGTHLVSFFL